MVVAASAIVAILAGESDAAALLGRLEGAAKAYVSPVSLYDAVLGLARARDVSLAQARWAVEHFIEQLAAEIVPLDGDSARAALDAFERFGKGRHAAALTLGDCFAYASARKLDVPILCQGADFAGTDIATA